MSLAPSSRSPERPVAGISRIQGIKISEGTAGIDRTAHIKKLFSLMGIHASVIERGMRSAIQPGDKESDDAIKALSGMSVLLPYDDTAYHLNPDVRNVIRSVLNQFASFEMLTRINHTIVQLQTYWSELKQLQSAGEEDDIEQLEITIENSVTDLIHRTEHNLLLLNSQIVTDYGNVASFTAKLAQNKSYGKQIEMMQSELGQVRELVELIEREAMGEAMHRVRTRIVSRLSLRQGSWFKRLNDVNAIMSARLNKHRILTETVQNVRHVDLWLTRNPTLSGMSIEPDDSVNAALLAPQALRIRPQIDLSEVISSTGPMATSVKGMLARLPSAKNPFVTPSKPSEARFLKRKGMEVVKVVIEPVDQMAADLIRAMRTKEAVPTSIRSWQSDKRRQEGLTEEAWLLYAATQLGTQGVRIDYVYRPRHPNTFNNVFTDIVAHPSPLKPQKVPADPVRPSGQPA